MPLPPAFRAVSCIVLGLTVTTLAEGRMLEEGISRVLPAGMFNTLPGGNPSGGTESIAVCIRLVTAIKLKCSFEIV